MTDHDVRLPQGRDDCPRCAALEERVRELEAVVAELRDRLRADSSNSSTAPSSDPLWAANVRQKKKPTGRKPGGQKGHEGHHRQMLPAEEVDEVVEHVPARCAHCHAALGAGCGKEVRSRHQVAELPPRAVVVTEHRGCAVTCPCCGEVTVEPIPSDVRRSCAGPRLSAALCYLSGRVHGSRRAVEEVADEVLGLPLSLGTVSAREAEMAAALDGPCDQVRQRVRDALAKNVDETGWRRAARWLWVAATRTEALFRLDRGRNWHGLQNLLGELVQGTVCSDRYGVYEHLKPRRRAICWAHLQRDFQRWVDRGGKTVRLGEEGLAIAREVFRLWHRFRSRKLGRKGLRHALRPLVRRTRELLKWGLACGVTKAVHFCRNLKKVRRALFTFARVKGIEPTNNHAERMLRPAVCWRKTCLGSHSEQGCVYAERMMTTTQTLRLRGRGVMDFLTEALTAHRQGSPAPSLA